MVRQQNSRWAARVGRALWATLTSERGEVNVDGLWGGGETGAQPPAPGSGGTAGDGTGEHPLPSSPAEDLTGLKSQVQFLTQAVTSMFGRGPQAQAQQPHPTERTEPGGLAEWQDGDFLTEEETQVLLNADGPGLRRMFNKLLNGVGRSIDQRYRGELQRLNEQVQTSGRVSQEQLGRIEQQRQQEGFRSQFFSANPDLQGEENAWLVGQAAQQVQAEAAREPWKFAGGHGVMLAAVADRARSLRAGLLQRWQAGNGGSSGQGEQPGQAPQPKRRQQFFNESNNSSRAQGGQKEPDPIKAGVGELIDWRMGRGR